MLYQKFYGQTSILKEVFTHLKRNKSVLLCGEKGTGKTAIAKKLNEMISNEGKYGVCYLSLITSRKPFHQELLYQLSKYINTIPEEHIFALNTNVNTLLAEINKGLSQLHKCICIVEVEKIPTNLRKDLLQFMQNGMLLVFVSRSFSIHKEIDENVAKVKLENLSKQDAEQWIDSYLKGKKGEDKKQIKQWLLKKSGCHPGAIAEAFNQWEQEPVLNKEITEKTSVKKPAKQRYLYFPMSVLFVITLMINRHSSRLMHGGGDRIDYLIGAIGWIIGVTFLVFFFGALKKSTAITDGTI